MYTSIPKGLTDVTLAIEKGLNGIVTHKYNPFYYHGALPQFYLWVLFISGLLLFAYYIPTIENAYISENLVNAWTSVDYITDDLPMGAVIRGIHRYAGDAMVLTIVLHALRVWITDRYRQYRWIQWVTGVALLFMVLFIGQTGYYLVWDERSLILTRMTVSALGALPFVGHSLQEWFLNGTAITNLTLSNFLFIHIGLSFTLLFGLWMHYVRMTRPVITPPPALNYILMGVLLIVVFMYPVTMGKMADINGMPTSFELDWFFLWPYALLASLGNNLAGYWFIIIGGAVAFTCVPLPQLYKAGHPVESAEVVLNKCTGCSMCYNDCPYQAIEMVPAPAGSRFKLLATVKSYRCSGCGVCVGACAFDAIDLPDLLDTDVKAKIKELAELKA
jgi:quinol-cytochrome oxidoreductase complex cytochrome b subunit